MAKKRKTYGSMANYKPTNYLIMGISAVIIAILGALGVKTILPQKETDKNSAPEEPTMNSSQEDITEEATEGYKYVLSMATDMRNEEEVKRLLEILKNIGIDKKYSPFLDERALKYYNESFLNGLSRKDFSDMSDEEVVDYCRTLADLMFQICNYGNIDWVNYQAKMMNGETIDVPPEKEGSKITPFMMLDENSKFYKKYAKPYNDLIDEALKDIADSKKEDFKKKAEKFYDIIMEIINDKDVEASLKAMFLQGASADVALFERVLKNDFPDYYNKLFKNKQFQNPAKNGFENVFYEGLGLILEIKKEEVCTTARKEEPYYDSKDAKEAANENQPTKTDTTTVVTKNNHSTQTEVVSQGTTHTTTSTTVHTPPSTEATTETKPGTTGTTTVEEETTVLEETKKHDPEPAPPIPPVIGDDDEAFWNYSDEEGYWNSAEGESVSYYYSFPKK